jgi:hypothetical protein
MSYIGQEPGQGQAERYIYTASGSETVVSTADDGRVIGYTAGQVSVYLNGVKLVVGTDCIATNGSTITGLSALSASDVVEVIALSAFSPSDTVSASGGTFTGAVTASAGVIGNLTGNASGTAATVTTAAQPAITSVGTLTGFTSTGIDDNATSTAITISSAGEVTMPHQPAFNARGYNGTTSNVQLWATEDFDNANNFDYSGTGRFTAPVAGVYHFSFFSGYKATVNYLGYAIRKNGTIYFYTWSSNAASLNHALNGGALNMTLAVGDYVEVEVMPGYTVPDSTMGHTTFSGHLIG